MALMGGPSLLQTTALLLVVAIAPLQATSYDTTCPQLGPAEVPRASVAASPWSAVEAQASGSARALPRVLRAAVAAIPPTYLEDNSDGQCGSHLVSGSEELYTKGATIMCVAIRRAASCGDFARTGNWSQSYSVFLAKDC